MSDKQCTVCGKILKFNNKSGLCSTHWHSKYSKDHYVPVKKQSRYEIAREVLNEYSSAYYLLGGYIGISEWINSKILEIYETEPLTIGGLEVCDDKYDPRLDDSDMSGSSNEDR